MDQNVSKYEGFDPPEAHLCSCSGGLERGTFIVVLMVLEAILVFLGMFLVVLEVTRPQVALTQVDPIAPSLTEVGLGSLRLFETFLRSQQLMCNSQVS